MVECFRKSDDRPVALKFFQYTAIHKWYPESLVRDYVNGELLANSEFLKPLTTATDKNDEVAERFLPSEVACLLRAHSIPGVIKILDYIPADEHEFSCDSDGSDKDDGEFHFISLFLYPYFSQF